MQKPQRGPPTLSKGIENLIARLSDEEIEQANSIVAQYDTQVIRLAFRMCARCEKCKRILESKDNPTCSRCRWRAFRDANEANAGTMSSSDV